MQQTRMLLGARSRLASLVQTQLVTSSVPSRTFSNKDNFMSGANANYIDQMYTQW